MFNYLTKVVHQDYDHLSCSIAKRDLPIYILIYHHPWLQGITGYRKHGITYRIHIKTANATKLQNKGRRVQHDQGHLPCSPAGCCCSNSWSWRLSNGSSSINETPENVQTTYNKKQHTKHVLMTKQTVQTESTRSYDSVSARIVENGATVQKLWPKENLGSKT